MFCFFLLWCCFLTFIMIWLKHLLYSNVCIFHRSPYSVAAWKSKTAASDRIWGWETKPSTVDTRERPAWAEIPKLTGRAGDNWAKSVEKCFSWPSRHQCEQFRWVKTLCQLFCTVYFLKESSTVLQYLSKSTSYF